MRQFTWFHTSDFHIKDGDPYDRQTVLNGILHTLRNAADHHGYSPDVIFATGDIAFSGMPSQYEQASAFFDALLEAADLDKTRLFVIPGNHDIDRTLGRMLLPTLPDYQASIDFFGNPQQVNQYLAKQQAFREWYDGYFAGIRSLVPDVTCEMHEIEVNGLHIAVSLINSALFCQGEDHNKLWVGTRCLDPIAEQVRQSKADIRIALIHHPLDWLNDGERSVITATLNDTFDVILRGHLHETDVTSVDGTMGRAVHIACGAAYQGSRWPNRVLFARANYEENAITVRPIRYESSPRPLWSLDTSLYPPPHYEGHIPIAWKGQPPPSAYDGGG